MQHDVFDQTETYKSKIAPLVKEIKGICSAHKIPFFISFTIASGEEGEIAYKRDALTPTALKLEISNCMMYPLICIAAGSKAVPASSEASQIEYD